MLDAIEDNHGPVMADRVLAHARKGFNWWQVQDEDFKSPIIRGMARTKPKERSRERTLTDDEIRDVWSALDQMEGPACYPSYVRTLLMTMTRRNEASDMHSSEIDGDLWTIPGERYKNKLDHVIPLSAAAKKLLPEATGFVFSTTDGKKAFSGFSKAKAELDRLVAKARKGAGKPRCHAGICMICGARAARSCLVLAFPRIMPSEPWGTLSPACAAPMTATST